MILFTLVCAFRIFFHYSTEINFSYFALGEKYFSEGALKLYLFAVFGLKQIFESLTIVLLCDEA